MLAPRLKSALLIAAGSLALASCGYGPYGYSGVSVGYGSPYYGSGYGYSPYYGSGYGYGSPYYGYGYRHRPSYYGWHNNYYYPGTGYYVYGRDGRRWRWSESQRDYWERRRVRNPVDNWNGYGRPRPVAQSGGTTRVVSVAPRSSFGRRAVRNNDRAERSNSRRAEQAEARSERRRATRDTRRSDRRSRRDDD